MRAKWSCSPNEGCVLRAFAPLSCSTHSILKCTLVPPSTHSSPLVQARCLRWSATYGEEAGYTSLFRPFGSSKPGVCGANNSFVDLITLLPHLAAFKLKSHSLLTDTNISPPKLKDILWKTRTLFSKSQNSMQKGLVGPGLGTTLKFLLVIIKNNCIVGKLQISALCSECNSSALGQPGVHWRPDLA